MGLQSKEFNSDELKSEWLYKWFAVATQPLLEEDRGE